MWPGMVEKIQKMHETTSEKKNVFADLELLRESYLKRKGHSEILDESATPAFLEIYNQLNDRSNELTDSHDYQQEFKKVVQALILNNEIRSPQVLFVASVGKKAGCSQFVLNLANELKSSHQRTVVIDANIKSRGFTRFTRLHPEGLGLTDLLAGDEPVWKTMNRLDNSEVFLLERGRKRNNAVRVLLERNIAEISDLFADLFEYIIIEVPPLIGNTNLDLWAKKGDAIVLVETLDAKNGDALEQLRTQLNDTEVEFWGKCLSSQFIPIPQVH
ncbi:MAG: hypothetical protein DWQ05_10830 [Calditrichaeota bacterium]|nr:MAG: hypothetical protein DWQ05_10830 [Calditrichota bacterium]